MRWRKSREQELEGELRDHLELEAQEQHDFYAARRALGNIALIKEDTRAVWGFAWLDRISQTCATRFVQWRRVQDLPSPRCSLSRSASERTRRS